jgi:hypothetical protein
MYTGIDLEKYILFEMRELIHYFEQKRASHLSEMIEQKIETFQNEKVEPLHGNIVFQMLKHVPEKEIREK